jgi:hypothetical protein
MKKIGVIFLIFLFLGCVHRIELIDFNSGNVLVGHYNEGNRKVAVSMPDGEMLIGKYSNISNASVGFGTAWGFSGANTATAFGTGISTGGQSMAYALLKSKKPKSKLMMEIIVSYSDWTGHGYGEAITNDGKKYKVQF